MKPLLKIGLTVIVLIIVVVGVLYLSLNSLIKNRVEKVGPKVTGTSVTLDTVRVSPFSGRGQIRGLVIGNPEGFQTESAFKLSETRISLNVKSFLSDKIHIDEIYIDQPEITFEQTRSGSNISQIRKNVEKFSGSDHKSKANAAEQKGSGKRYEINRLVVKSARVKLSSGLVKGEIILSEIQINDIGKKSEGVTLEEAVSKVLEAITADVLRTASASGKLLEKPVGVLGESTKQIGNTTEKAMSGAVKGLKGFFGK